MATSQINEEFLKQLVAERQANLANAAQMGAQNPQPYNPREEFHRQNAIRQQQNPPITYEQMMAQLQGRGVDNPAPMNPQMNAANAAQQMQAQITQNQNGQNFYMPSTFDNSAPYAQNYQQTVAKGQGAPQADFGGAGGKQAGTPPTTYSTGNPTAQQVAKNVWKDPKSREAVLNKYKGKPGFENLAEIAANPQGNQGMNPEILAAAEEYNAAVKADNASLKDGMVDATTGAVWSAKGNGWVGGKEANAQTQPNYYQNAQNYSNIYQPYYQANQQALENLQFGEQVSPLDNPIPQFIPVTEEFLAQKEKMKNEANNPTGMKEQDEASAMIKQGAGATENETAMRKFYGGMVDPAAYKNYENALYESVAGRLRNEAADLRGQQAADLASRGLGMSTVVNDVQAETNKRLMQGLGEAGSRATAQAEEMRRGYLQDSQGLESNVANRGLNAGTQLSNVGAQKQNIYQSAQSPYMQAIQYQDANALLNLGLQNQNWQNKVNNAQYLLNLPQQINAGEANTQATAAKVGSNVYDAGLTAAAGHNQLVGQVASQIGNAFKPQQAYVPLQQVQGGMTGVAQGTQAGFKTPVKTTGAFQI